MNNIPSGVTIDVGFHVDDLPDIRIPGITVPLDFDEGSGDAGEGGGYQHGTGGRFLDFGAGTPVMLHGKERITPISEAGAEGAGLVVLEKRLVSIERLLRDQPRAFGLAIADSMTLMN